jgi:mRNA-degrading endonuclease toxin of MazEF toxin-antitoxin module
MILGVPTSLDKATVSVREGTLGLDGLTLGSPEGFTEPSMFELTHAHVTMDIGSVRSDEILVHEVVIDGPQITLEFAGGKTNWGTLLARLETPPTEEQAKSEKKVRIDRIVISNAKVRLAGIPLAGSATVPLPTLEITDLAQADGTGQTVGNVLGDVIRSLYTSILSAAKGVLPTEQVEKLAKEAGAVLGDARDAVKDAGSTVQDAATGAAKGVSEKATGVFKGIMGGKEEEEKKE